MSVESAVSGISSYSKVMKATSIAKAMASTEHKNDVQVRTKSKPGTIADALGSSTVTTYPKLDTFSLGSKIDIRG
jgi:hypothetical protein